MMSTKTVGLQYGTSPVWHVTAVQLVVLFTSLHVLCISLCRLLADVFFTVARADECMTFSGSLSVKFVQTVYLPYQAGWRYNPP